jgi:hypothetical protein
MQFRIYKEAIAKNHLSVQHAKAQKVTENYQFAFSKLSAQHQKTHGPAKLISRETPLLLGDDVAVPALGQSNFLLSLFGLFFILASSIMLLAYLDLRFLILCVDSC